MLKVRSGLPFLALFLFFSFSIQAASWETDLDSAFIKSKEHQKYILLNFSGSDWCIPCRKLKTELFSNPKFIEYGNENLVLVNLDFPLKKNNNLDKEYQNKLDAWAEKYNPNGIFPLTLLIDPEGKIIYKWTGYIHDTVDVFINYFKSLKT
jgi:thioredoxin-related protein